MNNKIILLIFVLFVLVGCEVRSADDIRVYCEKNPYPERCGYLRCIYEQSQSWSTHPQITASYFECKYQECMESKLE